MKKLLLASLFVFLPGVALAQNQGNVAPVAVVKPLPLPVLVTNPPDQGTNSFIVNPGDIAKAEGIQHPTQQTLTCNFGSGNFCVATSNAPATQRLVIEYASAHCNQPDTNLLVGVTIVTTAGGAKAFHQLTTDHSGALLSDNVTRVVTFGQTVRLYADPGSTITVEAQSTAPAQSEDCEFDLAGQAIDTQ